MKKIGKEVLFLKTSENNPRNGESTLLRLSDGRILHAYTEYYGDDWEDHATARISAVTSSDEGETWSAPRVLIRKPEEAQNIMSPSLFRLPDGALGILYLLKTVEEDGGISCMPKFSRSEDEGESFSAPVSCGMPLGYYCGINDGVLVTRAGRILMPMSYHGERYDAYGCLKEKKGQAGDIRIAVSDDGGATWYPHPHVFKSPYADAVGLAEPGLFEHENGDLWMYCRTAYGHQYDSVSTDGGETWTPVCVNVRFPTPDAPMRVKRVGDRVAAVYNPTAFSCLCTAREAWKSPKRTPIVVSLSRDDGRSFDERNTTFVGGKLDGFVKDTYLLEDDVTNSYCYPAILETKDGFLVSYYHSDGGPICLNATKVTKVYKSEISED